MFEIFQSIRRQFASGTSSWPTHVVPLGLSCRVSYQARTYFRTRTAYPFDWWLTPIDGLISYLSDLDPDRVYGPGALDEHVVNGHVTTVVAPEFGFQLFHEFPRKEVGLPVRVVAPGWRNHVPEVRARHARRLERLLALDRPGRRILFVRDRLDFDDKGADAAVDSVKQLHSLLLKLWSRAEVQLLLVNIPCGDRTAQQGVRWVDFEDVRGDGPDGWRGDSIRWADAFASADSNTQRVISR